MLWALTNDVISKIWEAGICTHTHKHTNEIHFLALAQSQDSLLT